MIQAEPMAKDKTFNLRLDEQDRKRLDEIAAHYSAPAATAVRMLIKEKHDELTEEAEQRSARRWFEFVEEVERFVELAEIPKLKVSFKADDLQAVFTDGKRERVASAANEDAAYAILANWPGSQLDCDSKFREFNRRTGRDAQGIQIAPPQKSKR